MRISVNLATRPFVELRPIFLRLRLLMAALALLGAAALVIAHFEQKKLDVETAQMDRLHAKMVSAQMEKLHNEQKMRQPANAEALNRAHFLNALFLRKSFSWTAVMMDLETVLPVGVQVTSIEPAVTATGEVVIRLRVSGERDRAVQLVRNLERSKRFLQPRLTGESVEAKEQGAQTGVRSLAPAGPPAVEFEILANYNPLPADEPFKRVNDSRAAKAAIAAPNAHRRASATTARDGVVLKPYAPQSKRGSGGRP
jgi:type IV pilus assembly protein PilN